MKKYTKLLTVFALVFVMVASLLTACQVHEHTFSNDWSNDTQYHWHAATCEHSDEVSQKGAHEDLNNDGACDICAYASCTHTYADEWSSNKLNHWKEATCGHNVKGSEAAHADGNGDGLCDTCNYECGDHKHTYAEEWSYDENSHWHAATCVHNNMKQAISDHKDSNKDYVCDICGYVSHVHTFEEGWLYDMDGHWNKATCEHTDAKVNYAEHIDEVVDGKCDVCLMTLMESVSYTLNISDLTAGTLAADEISGMFTIVSGSEIRNRTKTFEGVEYNKSVKIGNSATQIKVSVPGAGKLHFLVQNGSSGASTQFITVTAPDGTVHDIEFPGTNEGSPVVKIELEVTEGEWVISRGKNGGTQDIFFLELACVVEVSPENGFKLVAEGKVDYLVGEKFDSSRIQLNSTFANGKTDVLPVESVTIDSSKVDMTKAGVYEVTISYKEYTPITYEVSVYAPDTIELGFDAIEKIANSAAGNGVYFNHSFREVYGIGDELDTAGLSVKVIAKCGEKTLAFTVSDYEITGFDSATAGTKVLTIATNGLTTNVNVDVVDTAIAEGNQVKVDKAYTGTPGAIEEGFNMFTTIQQALDFLAKVEPSEAKLLVIGEGLFTEKLEITIPNLTIRGAGKDKTIIEWDSLYGLIDAGGFTHTTDSTQTVAVREQAVNCVIEDLTISNYWNTQERMDEANLAIERGLALLVQADRFIMRDSALLGIQDTLELFTGRQYFENVFISGYTDFIFGTNNTTYFKNCVVHVIDTGKDDAGTAGYLTAFKGSNKGAADSIVYGAIFDGCKFTADEGVTLGKTAIGRTWGAYAAVAVINSDIGGHISVDGYDSANNKNKRYISMNGIHPTDATVQFVEFNNTGAGAIAEAVAGMKMLTADEAAKYADFATIYGTINGNVSYLDPWDPTSGEIVVDDRDYYYFTGASSTTGTSHTFDTTTTIAKGSTLEWDGLLISAENGNVAWNQNANSLNMKAGAFIKFTVPAGSIVTVETYPNYNYFTLNGVGTASANMLSQYYAEQTEVTLLSTGDLYLYSIIINPGEQAPATATLKEIKVEGFTTHYELGADISLEGVVVKAIYSDNSVVALDSSAFSVDSSAVVKDAEGAYAVVFSYEGATVTVDVFYEDPNAGPEISKNTILDFSTPDALAAVQNNPKVTIEGSVRHNGAEIQIQGTISFKVKAGTVVTVMPYANTQYVSYTLGKEGEEGLTVLHDSQSMMFFEDCTVVYTGLENNYLVSISIECPLAAGKYVFGGSTVEGDVTGILESIPGMSISGTCKTHSGGAQLGADSQIIFIAPALATVTVQGFDTNYGQLSVMVDGVPVEMNDKAQYVFTLQYASTVIIEAVNVGTEEAPAWNQSYITYINLSVPTFIEENLTVSFGSAGNYKESGIDFSGITIGDNGGNNSQVKEGSFSFAVRKGAIVTINGYSGYTAYSLSDGDLVYENITEEKWVYEASSDCILTITPTSGNNYFYGFSIEYPSEAVTYTLDITQIGSDNLTENLVIGDFFTATLQVKSESIKITGASYEADGLVFDGRQVSLTKGKVQVNDGVWSNSISFTVAEGQTAKVVIYAAEKSDKKITLKVMNEAGETVTISDLKINGVAAEAFDTLPIDKVHKYEFTLSAGTYHIGGAGGGAYIYGMSVTVE
ncbi:MAG: bacterial Ig-like domain-containing protein [Clostridia bacterium]|nr:bacterial Ig-like domain-containing protein [Clostridia bacterium]